MEQSPHEEEKIERLRRAMYSRALSDKLHGRERRELEETRPLVGEEWTSVEESLAGVHVAPRFIGLTRRVLSWALIGSIGFFVLALGFFVYFFMFGGGSHPAAPQNIDISVAGPPQIAGGAPVELQIVVTNRNKVGLELADLVITYPAGTRSPTDFATDLPSTRIPLGTIEAGGRRQGTVSAVFAGEANSEASVLVELEYRVSASSAIFVARETYPLVFSSSPLSISFDGNTQTISGQPIEIVVHVMSNASAPMKDVLLSARFPFGFKLAQSTPAAKTGNLWTLGDFLPGQRKSVTLQGTLSGESGDERVFKFAAGTRSSTSGTAIDTTLAESSHSLSISQPFLGLSITVNKEAGSGAIVAPGENVAVSVAYQNNLPTPVSDAVIVARLSGISVDGATVHSTDGFYRSTDEVVLWDKSTTRGQLGSIPPGARGSVSFSFQVPSSEALKNITNPSLTISVNAAGKRLSESGVPQNLQSAAVQKVKLATDLSLVAQGLYYANPFGSSGPMPPKAGTETTYAIVFTVTNTTNKIVNAQMTARMPAYVRWTGIYSPSSEKIAFNQLNGTVTWDLGEIAPNVGVGGVQSRQAAIAIGLTPSTSQIGQSPPLLTDIKLTGTDVSTNASISRTANNVTTNILGDPGFTPANATVVK